MSKIIILLLGFSLQIQASSYSQVAKFTLKLENVTVKKVFNEIEKSSEFRFVYKKSDVSTLGKVSLDVKSLRVEEILDKCFMNSNISYTVMDKHIVIKKLSKVKDEKKDGYITGKVIDEKCNPMPGVTVVVQGTKIGVSTDAKGKYKIKAKKGDALKFTFIGYKTQLILIKDQKKVDVKMQPEREVLEETTVVAFATQKKESVVSSITSVKSEELKSSSSDLTSAFAGKIAGMIGWQTGGAPGALTEEDMNTKFYIRGITSFQSDANIDPLILLDGVEISKLDLARIDPDDIDSFNVMKDASATAMYGARGANGVIYVKTKKGKEGTVYTTFRYERIYSMPTRDIDVVDPVTWMKMYNEALLGRDPKAIPKYDAEKIARTESNKYPDYVYPNNDWYKTLFKDFTVNNHYALNVRGGSARVQYYASIGHNQDVGMLKTDPLNQFNCNIKNKRTTFNTNLNVNLNKTAKLTLTSFSTYDDYNGPCSSVKEAYYMAFKSNPVDFAPVYPKDENYNWPHVRFGGSSSSYNPYAVIHRGYVNKKRFSTVNKFEYIQNFSKWCKGLEVRISAAMTKTGYFSTGYTTEPARYELSSYDHTTGIHTLNALNENQARRTLELDRYYTGSSTTTSMEYKAVGLYTAAWGNHQTSITGVVYCRELDNNFPSDIQTSLPQRNLGYSSRISYGYKDRYFIESSLGINGSERFSKNHKIGYFPSIGGAWIASKENFMRPASNWLSFLKFRFSYGKVGNDGIIKTPRFVFLESITRATDGANFGQGSKGYSYYDIQNYANEETTWEVAEQTNFGAEIKLFKGLIEANVDIYQEIRHNICALRKNLPSSVGLLNDPLDNVGKVKSNGVDLSFKIQHAFNPDFWFIFNGTLTYNKAKFKEFEEATGKPEWQKRVGHEISQQYGYIDEGLFRDWDEIRNSAYQSSQVMPGDIKYKDINGDGKINVEDAVAIGYPQTPRLIYGSSLYVHYKNFEFNMSFQGSGNRSFWINPAQVSPFYKNQACLKAFAEDHWTPENQKVHPLWPRLSTNNIITHNPQENYYDKKKNEVRKSTYFMKSGKFIRCKAMELSYYIDKRIMERLNMKKLKIYARVNNPFIISDFDLWDIELGESGFNYPIQKTFSLGLNFSF